MTVPQSLLLLRLLRFFATLSLVVSTAIAADVPTADGLYAVLETTKGPIVCELFFREAPLTSMNFAGLAEGTIGNTFRKPGEPFFDGLTFHRVVKDFVVQGGDPKGDGEGGPGYSFTDEFSPRLRHDRAGMLSMANDGPNTNGSQFFITLRDTNRLNYLHSVFGRVVSGMDVVERIEQGDKIDHVKIVRVGDAAKKFQTDVIAFEIYKKRALLLPDPVPPAGFTSTADPLQPGGVKPAYQSYFVDGTKSLPEFRVKNFDYKLRNYHKFRRERIAVRLYASEKLFEEERASKLTSSINSPDDVADVLIYYFAAEDRWRIFGAPLMANGKPAPTDWDTSLSRARELSKEGKLKEAVDAAIDTVMMRLDDDQGVGPVNSGK